MDVLEFGPFKLDAIKGTKLRYAKPNSFCLTGEGLFWKFHIGHDDPDGYLPFSGDQAFKQAGKSVRNKPAIELCHSPDDLRLTVAGPEVSQSMDSCVPGSVIMSSNFGLCLLILVGQERVYVDFATGRAHWHFSDDEPLLWFRGWRLTLNRAREQPITLAAHDLDA